MLYKYTHTIETRKEKRNQTDFMSDKRNWRKNTHTHTNTQKQGVFKKPKVISCRIHTT